jgi:hypothetical protein
VAGKVSVFLPSLTQVILLESKVDICFIVTKTGVSQSSSYTS